MTRKIGTKTLRERCEEIVRLIDDTLEAMPGPSVLPVRVDGRRASGR